MFTIATPSSIGAAILESYEQRGGVATHSTTPPPVRGRHPWREKRAPRRPRNATLFRVNSCRLSPHSDLRLLREAAFPCRPTRSGGDGAWLTLSGRAGLCVRRARQRLRESRTRRTRRTRKPTAPGVRYSRRTRHGSSFR